MSVRHLLPILSLFFLNCYSADRDNPLDPIRTEAVTLLSAHFDDVAQAATLVWTPYHGIEPLQRYEIQRKEQGENESVVGTVSAVADTSYVDDTLLPGVTYTYWVLVRNTADLTVLSVPKQGLTGKVAAPIQIFEPVFDRRTATAQIRWTRFPGTTFSSYELIRRSAQDVRTLAILQNPADTTFTDINLLGNVEYTYQVALNRTDGRRLVLSAEPNGMYLLQASFGSFSEPVGIDVSPSGNHLYVADAGDGKIKKYNRSGGFVLSWGESGTGDHQFAFPPTDVLVDQSDNVWVAFDPGSGNVANPLKKFNSSGVFLLKSDNIVGSRHIALAANGDIIANGRIGPIFTGWTRTDPQGAASTISVVGISAPPDVRRHLSIFSDIVAVSHESGLTVLAFTHNQIVEFVNDLGGQGTGPGALNRVQGNAFDGTGLLYVVDAGDNRLKVYDDPSGNPTFITHWTLPADAHDVVVDSQGLIYVTAGGQVHRYAP